MAYYTLTERGGALGAATEEFVPWRENGTMDVLHTHRKQDNRTLDTLGRLDSPRVPDPSTCVLLTFLTGMTLITILGNTLVILAVATTRRLRSVTNCFIVSLSVADLLVGGLVMPLSLVYEMIGVWPFGYVMCELWSSLDIMLCTASILNLCCISLDRYFAITRPLTYTVKRNKRLALGMIGVVWLASAAVTFPPLLGWYERGVDDVLHCQYVSDKGYVIYSACGSFYIPLAVMLFVYTRIFVVIYRRNRVVKQQKRYQKHGAANGYPAAPAASEVGEAKPRQYITSSRCKDDNHSDCLVSLEMASDSLLAVRPRRESGSLKATAAEGGGAAAGLFRSRSYQFQFHNGTPFVASQRRKSSKVESHLLTVPHWAHGPTSSPSSSGALNVSSTSTGSTFLYPPVDTNQRAKMSLPSLGIPPSEQASLLQANHHGTKHYHRKHARGLRMSFRKETKATTTIAVVVGGFVVCWMPFFLVYIVHPFCEQCAFSPLLVSGLTWLGWANSAVNPFIYAFYNMDFRAAFWKLTFGRCCVKRPTKGTAVVLYPQVWRSRLKSSGANGVPSIVMVQSDVM